MEAMWSVFYWTGPIGVGIFLLLMGTMVFMLATRAIRCDW